MSLVAIALFVFLRGFQSSAPFNPYSDFKIVDRLTHLPSKWLLKLCPSETLPEKTFTTDFVEPLKN